MYVPLPLAPVQRHADHPGHLDGDGPPEVEPADTQRAPADAPPVAAPPAVSAPLVGDAPPLAAPSTSPEATGSAGGGDPPPGPALPLSGPIVQRSAFRRPVGLGRPIAAVPPGAVPPGTAQRAPLDAPPPVTAPLVGAEALRPTSALPLAAVADDQGDDQGDDHDDGPDAGPSLDLAQRAPAGSGAPSLTPIGGEAVAVAPLLGHDPLGSTPAPAGGEPDDASASSPPGASPDALAGAGPRAELGLVQRAPLASGASAPTSAATTASSSSSATTPVAASRPPMVVAPLLGGRPFATQVQRTGSASAPAGPVDRSSPEALSPEPGRVYQPLAGIGIWNGAPPPDLPGPAIEAPPSHLAAAVQRATGTDVSNVRIRRDTGPTAQRLSARAFTHEGDVHIPASVGSLHSGEGASLATHELVHAGQQAVLGSSRPHEHTPEGQALEAQARSAEHASLAGLELPKMPLAAPAAPAVQRAPTEGGTSSPFSPHQLSTLLGLADNPPTGMPAVQRVSVAEPEAPPPPAGQEPPGAAPSASEEPQTPEELAELATKLFPTMRNLFRSELLGFRRRSGTSSDRPLS